MRDEEKKRVGEVWGGHPWIDIEEKTRGRPVSKKSREQSKEERTCGPDFRPQIMGRGGGCNRAGKRQRSNHQMNVVRLTGPTPLNVRNGRSCSTLAVLEVLVVMSLSQDGGRAAVY